VIYTPVPEPAALLLALTAIAPLATRRGRKLTGL
jgi:hypothetical protein